MNTNDKDVRLVRRFSVGILFVIAIMALILLPTVGKLIFGSVVGVLLVMLCLITIFDNNAARDLSEVVVSILPDSKPPKEKMAVKESDGWKSKKQSGGGLLDD